MVGQTDLLSPLFLVYFLLSSAVQAMTDAGEAAGGGCAPGLVPSAREASPLPAHFVLVKHSPWHLAFLHPPLDSLTTFDLAWPQIASNILLVTFYYLPIPLIQAR